MFYETAGNKHGLKHNPFKALVAPRPIGWISSLDRNGVINLAPYSYFNAISHAPPYVMFSSGGHKDSSRNIEETGEFVCSFVTYDLREQMNMSSAQVGPDVDEFELAGLTQAPSRMVKPPRVAESPAALECRYYKTIELPGLNGGEGSFVVLGEVVGIYIADDAITEGLFDLAKIRPIARLGYMDYAVVDNIFSMDRPD